MQQVSETKTLEPRLAGEDTVHVVKLKGGKGVPKKEYKMKEVDDSTFEIIEHTKYPSHEEAQHGMSGRIDRGFALAIVRDFRTVDTVVVSEEVEGVDERYTCFEIELQ